MARILRGIGVSLIGFFVTMIGVMSCTGTMSKLRTIEDIMNGVRPELDFNYLMQENPFGVLFAYGGIALMTIAIPYYWIIEPLLNRRKEKVTTNND